MGGSESGGAARSVVTWERDFLLVWPDGSVASLVCRWCRGSLRARWAGTGWSVRHAQVRSCGPLEHDDLVHPRELRSRSPQGPGNIVGVTSAPPA